MSKDEMNDNELDAVVGGTTNTASLSEMSTDQQLTLQQMMDAKSTTETTLSNIMKTTSNTSSSIISNLK